MTIEDLVRIGLRAQADRTSPIANLVGLSIQRGRRRRLVRRAAITAGSLCLAATLTLTGVVISHATPQSHSQSPWQGSTLVTAPWWKSWLPARHNGPIDHALVHRRRHMIAGHSKLHVYATGTTPDGLSYVFFTQTGAGGPDLTNMESDGSTFSMVESPGQDQPQPALTWIAGLPYVPYTTVARGKWLIVVGRPGTTRIDYSADGVHWQPMATRQGIGELFIKNNMVGIPDTSRIRLYDDTGIYVRSASVGRL